MEHVGADGAPRLKPCNLWPSRREEAWGETVRALNLGKFLTTLDLVRCLEGIPRMEHFMVGKLVSASLSVASNVVALGCDLRCDHQVLLAQRQLRRGHHPHEGHALKVVGNGK